MSTFIFDVLLLMNHMAGASKSALMRSHAHQVHVPTSMQVDPDGAVVENLRPSLFQTSAIDMATAGEASQGKDALDKAKCGTAVVLQNPPETSRKYSSSFAVECRYDESKLFPVISMAGCQWWASMLLREEWLQMDLGSMMDVRGVVLQGCPKWHMWITSYKVRHSNDGKAWRELPQEFAGGRIAAAKAQALFPSTIKARFVRVVPTKWVSKYITARAAVLVCGSTCAETRILDPAEAARSYSSVFHDKNFRYASSMMDSAFQWVARGQDVGEWMQLDLGSPMTVTGAVTQGSPIHSEGSWVTRFKVSYSNHTAGPWTTLPQEFAGNVDMQKKAAVDFPTTFKARFVNLWPMTWASNYAGNNRKGYPQMRAALLVCDESPAAWRDTFNAAMSLTTQWAQLAAGAWSSANSGKISEWFGVKDRADAPEVGNVLAILPRILRDARFLMPQPGNLCYTGILAYTIPDSSVVMGRGMFNPVVYLCEDFFLSTTTLQHRAGILLHEALHCAGTTDVRYGREQCASLDNKKKPRNTNNYVYFLKDVVSKDTGFAMPEGTLASVDCSRLPGTLCEQSAGVCKMKTWLATQSCADYCEVNGLYCLGASSHQQCSAASSPDLSLCQFRYDDKGQTDYDDPSTMTCWCTPIELASQDVSTTTPRPTTTQRTTTITTATTNRRSSTASRR